MRHIAPLLLLATTLLPSPAFAQNPAEAISSEIFGPRVNASMRRSAPSSAAISSPRSNWPCPAPNRAIAAAQTLIAEIYAKGLGVAENPQRAAGWYQLASNNGDMLASFELALLYQEGAGVPLNRQRAADLFSKAADAGYMPAKYNLALLHVEGIYASPSLTDSRHADQGSRRCRTARGAV